MKRIIILAPDNGVGLSRDAKILLAELSQNTNNRVEWIDTLREQLKESVDILIHLEIVEERYMRFARHNVIIPNPEWYFDKWNTALKHQSVTVFAKTRDTENIFKSKCKTVYTSFTSIDLKMTGIGKSRSFLHVAGKSSSKGTSEVIEAFSKAGMPFLRIYTSRKQQALSHNVEIIRRYVPDQEMKRVMNGYMFHVCTSTYEGFGHYINEAKSVGAVIITTNHCPMNELVTPAFGFACEVDYFLKQRLAMTGIPKVKSIQEMVINASKISNEQAGVIAQKTRNSFEVNDTFFKTTIHSEINKLI